MASELDDDPAGRVAVTGESPEVSGAEQPVVAMAVLRPVTRNHDPAPAMAAVQGEVPRAETVTDVAASLVRAGFSVGPPNGPTVAIEASAAVFEEYFGTELLRADDGGWTASGGDELPVHSVPEEVRESLLAVVIERPAEIREANR